MSKWNMPSGWRAIIFLSRKREEIYRTSYVKKKNYIVSVFREFVSERKCYLSSNFFFFLFSNVANDQIIER